MRSSARWGQLNRPKLPEIDGRDSFRGPAFHTAQWEAEHDLEGKRIVVIGTGASAFQTVPEIAKVADRVTVFQRTPPWVSQRPDYHAPISDAKHWLLNEVPFYGKWYRFWMFWTTGEGLLSMVRRDPDWDGHAEGAANGERSVSEANDRLRAMLTANVERMVGDDPEPLRQVPSRLSARRQAHAHRQRPLVPGAQTRQRGTGHGSHRPHHPGGCRDRVRTASRSRRDHLRHRVLRQPAAVPHEAVRQERGSNSASTGVPIRAPTSAS